MTTIQFLLWLMLAAQLLPYLISCRLTQGWKFQKTSFQNYWSKGQYLIHLCWNLVILTAAYWSIFHAGPLGQMKHMLTMNCSYRDLLRLTLVMAGCLVVTFLCHGLAEFLLRKHLLTRKASRSNTAWVLVYCSLLAGILFSGMLTYMEAKPIEFVAVCRNTRMNVRHPQWQTVSQEACSYITLRNTGLLRLEGEDLYLASQLGEEGKPAIGDQWKLPWFELAPGEEYQCIIQDKDPIQIKKKGHTMLYLLDDRGDLIDQVEVAPMAKNQVYCRQDQGWHLESLIEEAPSLPAPEFSVPGGYYKDPFALSITARDGLKVYYTLDCSQPDEHACLYEDPISIYDRSQEESLLSIHKNVILDYLEQEQDEASDSAIIPKAFVVRAIAMDDQGHKSETLTQTYYLGEPPSASNVQYTISLVVEPEDLFGDQGIYVTGPAYDSWYASAVAKKKPENPLDRSQAPQANFLQQGQAWERKAQMEVCQAGQSICNQTVGIRVQGHGARYNRKKRFSLYARNRYSNSEYFDVNLLNEYRQHDYLLRYGNMAALSQALAAGRDLTTADCKPVEVYLNGEFWYKTYLYERFSQENLGENYQLNPHFIQVIKNGENEEQKVHTQGSYWELIHYPQEHDMGDPDHYDYYCSIVDIQSYIDMLCYQLFLGNLDVQEEWNNMAWHTLQKENEKEGDGRWRWCLYDMDLGWHDLREEFGQLAPEEINPFTMYGRYQEMPIFNWPSFQALRANPEFCQRFVNTFMDLLNSNFRKEVTFGILDHMKIYDEYIRNFFEKRPGVILPYLEEAMKLKAKWQPVTLSTNQPDKTITLNSIQPLFSQKGMWYGAYYPDYPISLAVADDHFSHWEIQTADKTYTSKEKQIQLPIEKGGVKIHAVFQDQ